MIDDSDINHTRHARAAVAAVVASVIGDPLVYVSGGAEHQGPSGGGPGGANLRRGGRGRAARGPTARPPEPPLINRARRDGIPRHCGPPREGGGAPATRGGLPATKGWVAATKGELAGSTVEENRGATDLKGITTEGVVAVNLSPPAHAGAARASTARITTTPLRRITPRSTGGPAALFTLTSEFCPARHPTSTRPIGRSRDPRDDSRRGRPAPAAPAPHADSAHRGPRSGRRGASPRGRGRR